MDEVRRSMSGDGAGESPRSPEDPRIVYASAPPRRPASIAWAALLAALLFLLPFLAWAGVIPGFGGTAPSPPAPVAQPLTVVLNPSGATGPHPLVVAFSSTVAGGTPPYAYRWNFGDGSTCCGVNSGAVTHQFNATGPYEVSLVVTDAAGSQAQAGAKIEVDPTLFSDRVLDERNVTLLPGIANSSPLAFTVPNSPPSGTGRLLNASLSLSFASLGCEGASPCDAFDVAVMTTAQVQSFERTGIPSAVWCNNGGDGSGCTSATFAAADLDLTTYEGTPLYLVLWSEEEPGSQQFVSASATLFGTW